MAVNVLAYTTLTPYPCDEAVVRKEGLAPGAPCLSKGAVRRLLPLVDGIERPLGVREPELVPSDGSKESEAIRSLMAKYECTSEMDLLFVPDIISKLGKRAEEEKKRFKTRATRHYLVGTFSRDQDDILWKWSKIFPFFIPAIARSYIKGEKKDSLDSLSIMKMRSIYGEKLKATACPISIATTEDGEAGFHAVGMFCDMRGKNWSIEYFDSGGVAPPLPVAAWMERERQDIMKRTGRKVVTSVMSGGLIHQTETTSCGLFVLIFIRRRLEGIPAEMFTKFKIPDEHAIDFRRRVYSSG